MKLKRNKPTVQKSFKKFELLSFVPFMKVLVWVCVSLHVDLSFVVTLPEHLMAELIR